MERPIIGFTTGDLNGIGLELIIKIFSDSRMLEHCTPVIFASNKVINYYRRIVVDHNFNFVSLKNFNQLNPKQVNIFNCWDEEVSLHPGTLTEAGGKYAVRSLTVAVQCLKDKNIDALVTAPIHKSNTQLPEFQFTGHTPYLKDAFEADDVLMLLYDQGFRVGLVTEHVPVSQIADRITKHAIHSKIAILEKSLVRDFGIDKPKIAVLGLNPHCGDHGLIGKEELETIKPTIDECREKNLLVFGPYSADAFFARRYDLRFDAVLAMYHDQGLIPFKSLSEGAGVNYTAGLPVVRTSPDHGVAFDIAGKNVADPTSMREATFQAIDLLAQQARYDENTANPLVRQRLTQER